MPSDDPLVSLIADNLNHLEHPEGQTIRLVFFDGERMAESRKKIAEGLVKLLRDNDYLSKKKALR